MPWETSLLAREILTVVGALPQRNGRILCPVREVRARTLGGQRGGRKGMGGREITEKEALVPLGVGLWFVRRLDRKIVKNISDHSHVSVTSCWEEPVMKHACTPSQHVRHKARRLCA